MNCTVCGGTNAPGTRYCGNCGRPLGDQPGAPAADQGAPAAPQQPEQGAPSGDYPPPDQYQQPAPGGDEAAPGYAPPDQYQPEQYQPEPTVPAGEYPPPGYGAPEQYPPGQYPQPEPTVPAGEYAPPGYGAPDQYQQPPPAGGYPPPGYPAPGAPGGPGYPPGPSGQMYAGYPPGQPPQQKKKRRGLFIALAVLIVVALAGGAFIIFGGDDDDAGSALGTKVVLEPVSTVRPGGFTDDDSLDLEDVTAAVADALAGVPAFSEELAATLAGRSTQGSEPGLYGGSQDVQTCDVEGLLTFLTAEENAAKAEAWADTLGVDVSGIPDYVAGLTAVRLRFDTRVTNHGFRDGEANGFQSVLQAGTAVLVDDEGIPRVKCNCGNPLLEPEPLGDVSSEEQTQALDIQQIAENPQDAWEGLDTANVVTVTPGDQVTVFVLVSPEGRLFKRPVGSAGTEDERVEDVDEIGNLCETFGDSPTCVETTLGSGDVQATLRWSSSADLDLHVREPDGTEISYLNKGPSSTGGQLDVDSNINCVAQSGVENVFWPPGEAPTGDYVVSVNGFSVGGASCGGGDYELTIKVSGQEDQVISGAVAADETDEYPVTFGG